MSHGNGSSTFVFQVMGILKPVTVSTDKGLQLSHSPMVGCHSLYGSNFDFRMTYLAYFQFLKKRRICRQNSRFCFTIFSMKNASTEKQSKPRGRAQKNEQDGHLQFLIFETLSQRFLQNIFRNFQFFEKIKNDEFAVTHSN